MMLVISPFYWPHRVIEGGIQLAVSDEFLFVGLFQTSDSTFVVHKLGACSSNFGIPPVLIV